DGVAQPGVQGETLALPVARGAEAAVLVLDTVLVLAYPLPDALDERLAAQFVAGDALAGQLPLDDGLRGDARVILAGNPQCRIAQHAVIADHDVFERGGDGVAQVQRAGHIGRRHTDDERPAPRLRWIWARLEVAVLLPPAIQTLLHLRWLVCLGNLVE